jgi:hypothetical protein
MYFVWTLFDISLTSFSVGLTRSMLSTIVNLILLGRTWVIWGRNRWIAIGMAMVLIPCTVFSYGYLFQQRPIVKAGACTAMSGTTLLSQKWIFALVNMLYDIIACVLCTIRLVRNIRAEKSYVYSMPSSGLLLTDIRLSIVGMSHVLLSDGIGYFVIVMIGHALNLSFLRSPQPAKQSSFLTFNVALSSVLSQRIITSLYERTSLKEQSKPVSSRSRSKGYTGALSTGTAPPNSPFSPMTPSSPFGRSPTTPNSAFPLKHGYNDDEIELSRSSAHPISIDVHSQIEEEKDTKSYLYPRAA